MALSSGATPALALILFACGLMLAGGSPAAATAGDSVAGDRLMMGRFLRWQAAYNRSYANAAEKRLRFEVYRRNIEHIEATNRAGNLTYQLGENQFADLTEEEFVDMYLMKGMPTTAGRVDAAANATFADGVVAVDAPPTVDWRTKGAVVPPKNQGPSCSSCWAFVTAATIESVNKIKKGNLVSLSEQQLVDCDPYDGGCNLGYFVNGYRWVIENGGLTTEAEYPYMARRSYCARAKSAHHVAAIRDYVQVPAGEANLQNAVAMQPVAAAIEAGGSMQFYSGGVYSGQCGTRMNHAVTVIGYGVDNASGLKYWLVKNSWGQSWGEQGYVRMRRDVGRGGLCGIALDLAYPVV
ncbi:hypothetical protein ACP70R_046450 [Stipagrostis hirtigluma subsp. patula]